MKLAALIVLSVISSIGFCLAQDSNIKQAPVDFFKEEITLRVDDSDCFVSGTYYFRNNMNRTGVFPVAFPFYIDSLSLYPDSLAAYIVDNHDTIAIGIRRNIRNGSVMLNIPINAHETTIWHLDYRQRILSQRAVYIITSTATWGKPLEDATYRFITPQAFADVTTWPAADSVIEKTDRTEYISRKVNFMPRRDMEITWEK